MHKPELLAPAGNISCVYAAVQSGADSIYLGMKNFGARGYAENFDDELLAQAVDYCHLRGVKVYVTLNTLIADVEMQEALNSAGVCLSLGVDGVIVQDLGLISLIRTHYPLLPVHISTQASVMNSSAMKLAEQLRAVRTVVARELSFEEIKSITEKSSIETEIFLHGAQCYSYSGQCLMSSLYGGRSGNRGKCAGPCRLPYTLFDGSGKKLDKGYLLSPVDMCLGLNMEKILKSGAACLKIEGRMKGGEYVAAVSEIYRNAIDNGENLNAENLDIMQNTFSRGGFTAGLFEGKGNRIKKEDSNDDAYANQNQKLLATLRERCRVESNLKKSPVQFEFEALVGSQAKLKAKFEGIECDALGGIVQQAHGAPLTGERIETQLAKTGDYPFYAHKITLNIDDNIFIAIGEINALRRKVLDKLVKEKSGEDKKEFKAVTLKKPIKAPWGKKEFTALVSNIRQAKALESTRMFGSIYVPQHLFDESMAGGVFVPCFPEIIREKRLNYYINRMEYLKEIGVLKIVVSDWGMMYEAIKKGFEIVAGMGLNSFNSFAVEKLKNLGAVRVVLSPEMTAKQMSAVRSEIPLEAVVYGYIPLMKTANCPLKGMGSCGKNRTDCILKDRKGEDIPLVCDCMDCTAYLLNSKPIYMADKLGELADNVSHRCLAFSIESEEECIAIAERYRKGTCPEGDFTRGHFFRGVLQA